MSANDGSHSRTSLPIWGGAPRVTRLNASTSTAITSRGTANGFRNESNQRTGAPSSDVQAPIRLDQFGRGRRQEIRRPCGRRHRRREIADAGIAVLHFADGGIAVAGRAPGVDRIDHGALQPGRRLFRQVVAADIADLDRVHPAVAMVPSTAARWSGRNCSRSPRCRRSKPRSPRPPDRATASTPAGAACPRSDQR